MEPTQDQLMELWNRYMSEDGILGPLAFRYDVMRIIERSQDIARNRSVMADKYEVIKDKYTPEYQRALASVQDSFDALKLRLKALDEMQKKMIEEVA